ncbi:MAG: hypothetical protein ACLVJH_12065 [Faecalibacterium prausnitzii]
MIEWINAFVILNTAGLSKANMVRHERLLDYVKVYTTSDPESGTHPSAAREFDLAHKLRSALVGPGRRMRPCGRAPLHQRSSPATPGCE